MSYFAQKYFRFVHYKIFVMCNSALSCINCAVLAVFMKFIGVRLYKSENSLLALNVAMPINYLEDAC